MRFTPFAFIGTEYAVLDIQYLIVGGGGAAGVEDGAALTDAGGGGAGQFISGSVSIVLNPEISYAVTVGIGGISPTIPPYTRGLQGSSSIFLGITAIGGGGGGSRDELDGGNGASGGGANFLGTSTGTGGVGTAGFNGANAFYTSQPSPIGTYRAGCGGGAGSAAIAGTRTTGSIPGLPKAWLDGLQYAGGGGTGNAEGTQYTTISGSGGTGNVNPFDRDLIGRNGIIKIRYAGTTQLFEGGEIAISGGYVYHTFPSSSALRPLIFN